MESSHAAYGVHGQPSRVSTVEEEHIGWVTGHEYYSIGDLVAPFDAQNASQAANMKGTEVSV